MSGVRRVAIFGSAGQLGTDLVAAFRHDDRFEVIPLSHHDVDCTNADQVRDVMRRVRPDVGINSAAYVRVDECENRMREAFEVNAIGALNIARGCAEVHSLCVYISTDYVFDGEKAAPYLESDPTWPINVYGASKLAGEFLVRQTSPRWLIVRAASLFGRTGSRGKGGNFVETILKKAKSGEPLKIVHDVRMSPTYTRDAAAGLVGLVESEISGVIHLSNDGACSWYEFARHALEITGVRTSIIPISSTEYATAARRPKNSALESERSPLKLRSWQDALKAYLNEK
jgi:dTDP-4-dehydrorhamnose reductase